MSATDAQRRAAANYCRRQAGFSFRLNPERDAEVIEWLRGQPSLTEAVRRLIRRELRECAPGSESRGESESLKV